MIEITLENIIIYEKKENVIIYKPNIINKKLKYKIIFKSNKFKHIQFILNGNFINNIEFEYPQLQKLYKYEMIPYKGLLVSLNLSPNDIFIINIDPIDICTKIKIKNISLLTIQIENLIQIKWDNIFIINLPRRLDRKNLMEKRLTEANITKYKFISAYDGQDSQIQEKFNLIKKMKDNKIVTSGHFACLLSHIKAIKLAKKLNYSNIMILEDDVHFCDNFISKLSNLYVNPFNILYLGGIISKKKLFINDWTKIFNKKIKIMGAYAYILNSSIFDIVLEKLEKLIEYVDIFFIKEIQLNYITILLNDYIKTDLNSTDTSKKSKKLIKRLSYIN